MTPRCRPDGFSTRRTAAHRAWLIAETRRVEPYPCEQCGLWHLAAPGKEGRIK